jgi:hypothetical protein
VVGHLSCGGAHCLANDKWAAHLAGATYARCLIDAVPLIIEYNHVSTELRFLVFHVGGLTSSPFKPQDCRALRLFLTLLTWKTRGDAGLPERYSDVGMFVQRNQDDKQGVRMQMKSTMTASAYEAGGAKSFVYLRSLNLRMCHVLLRLRTSRRFADLAAILRSARMTT